MNQNNFCIITGASEGFGRALAIECAKRKFNLILVALPNSGVEELSSYLKETHLVEVYTFEKDLSIESHCYDLHYEISSLPISVNMLINNVGVGSTIWFKDTAPEFLEKQIRLNIMATTLLTRLFLNQLLCCKKSYILNVGSLSSYFYLPKKTVYGSTKSYIYYFSKSLYKELKPQGLQVSVICPGAMNTNAALTFQNRCSSWFTRNGSMNPEDVALIAIDGLLNGCGVIIPGIVSQLFRLIDHILPEKIKSYLTLKEMKQQKLPPCYGSSFQLSQLKAIG